jgi:hypothetical protein
MSNPAETATGDGENHICIALSLRQALAAVNPVVSRGTLMSADIQNHCGGGHCNDTDQIDSELAPPPSSKTSVTPSENRLGRPPISSPSGLDGSRSTLGSP